MTTAIVIIVIMFVLGMVILSGKGDNLIAGYNTASKEERAKYNLKRLRGLIGGLAIVLAPMIFLMHNQDTMAGMWSFIALVFVLCIVVVILANTWAKKKSM